MNTENNNEVKINTEKNIAVKDNGGKSIDVKDNAETKEKLKAFVDKAVIVGKKAGKNLKRGAENTIERYKKASLEHRMKKYSPLFPDDYNNPNFNIPNIIHIVDDAVRKDIDVCEGAIGWLEKVNGVEVFNLYDEWVKECGIQFIPFAKCDEVYCVDNFDRNKFVKKDYIFGKATEEKLAELEHIAYSLGAKSCSIEIVDMEEEKNFASKKVKSVQKNSKSEINNDVESKNKNQKSGRIVSSFEGNKVPCRPTLKWFSYDDNIQRLIEMRCSGNNAIKSKTLELKGSSYTTISQNVAVAIDMISSDSVSGALAMQRQAINENHSKIVFEVEF